MNSPDTASRLNIALQGRYATVNGGGKRGGLFKRGIRASLAAVLVVLALGAAVEQVMRWRPAQPLNSRPVNLIAKEFLPPGRLVEVDVTP